MEEIRKVKLPENLELLENFLTIDSVEFMPLTFDLRRKNFTQAYAGISESSIKSLVTIEENRYGIRIWPGNARFIKSILEKWGPPKGHFSVGVKHLHIARYQSPFSNTRSSFVNI